MRTVSNGVCSGIIGVVLICALAGFKGNRPSIRVQNVAANAGLAARLENNPTASKYLPETMAGGASAFDFDGDGRTDIFLTNGATLPSLQKDSSRYWNRLYRNLGGLKFEDVTERAGVAGAGYSIAAAAADYDNDGHQDLFVAGVGRNILYHNRGDGTFEDVSAKAGIVQGEWAVGAAWLDYDNDGRLDLFVVNYVRWSPSMNYFCGDSAAHIRVYCHPRVFEGTANRLYHNEGGGRFREVSRDAGIARHVGKGMAAVVADYDGDGYPDIFVTNDKMPNFLFHNLRNGKFEEVAMTAGVALPDNGAEISSMGADFRDYDNDGKPDVLLTALAGETFPLFRNLGDGTFQDMGVRTGMSALSRVYSGWGTGLVDLDNDGWKDIFAADSHVNDRVQAFEATEYKQHDAVFRNRGGKTFEDVSREAGPDMMVARAHRGCAFADFDGDGRVDVVVTALGEVPELLHNVTEGGNSWLILRLRGTRSNRDGIGARVRIGTQTNEMTSSIGYASSSLFGVHFGLGSATEAAEVEIVWPSGARQTLHHVKANQILQVVEPGR